jgi:Gpi18-like mannosyltransferase
MIKYIKKHIEMLYKLFVLLSLFVVSLIIFSKVDISISNNISFLIIWLLIYLVAFVIIRIYFFKNDIQDNKRGINIVSIIILLAFAIRLILAGYIEGYPFDIHCYKEWSMRASESLNNFYNPKYFVDYPPFYIIILSFIGKIINLFNLDKNPNTYLLMIKLPSICADLITAYFLYRIAKKRISHKTGIIVLSLYLFNPVILLNSSVWGQTDSFLTMIIVFMLYFLQTGRLKTSYALFILSVLTKPQAIFFTPILLFDLLKRKNIKHFINMILIGIITVIVVFIPFSFSENSIWLFYIKRFNIPQVNSLFSISTSVETTGEAAFQSLYASLNASNLIALLGGNFISDTNILFVFNYRTWGFILVISLSIFTCYTFLKLKKYNTFYISMFYMMGIFTTCIWMHERYMYPVLALLLMSYIYMKEKRLIYLFIIASVTHFFNVYLVLYEKIVSPINNYNNKIILISFFNVCIFIYLIIYTIKLLRQEKKLV